MTPVLDERSHRRARVRAVASAIVDRVEVPRSFQTPEVETDLKGSTRRRRGAGATELQPTPRSLLGGRRMVAAMVLILQLAALAAALWLPTFHVRTVAASGLHLLDQSAVVSAAAVPAGSLFTVDGDAVAARVRALPWVRTATVTTELPGTVRIAVTEWQPLVRVHRDGHDVFYAENGASLDATSARSGAANGIPLLIDDRSQANRLPVPPNLIRILGSAAQNFPSVFGVAVVAYQWDADGRFSVWAASGWRAVLGHVETDLAIAAVPDQLAALSTLRGVLDFVHPSFGYVDLENSSAPAVGGTPGLTAEVKTALSLGSPAAVAPAPATTPKAVATTAPTAAPTPTPVPTPKVFVLPAP